MRWYRGPGGAGGSGAGGSEGERAAGNGGGGGESRDGAAPGGDSAPHRPGGLSWGSGGGFGGSRGGLGTQKRLWKVLGYSGRLEKSVVVSESGSGFSRQRFGVPRSGSREFWGSLEENWGVLGGVLERLGGFQGILEVFEEL